MDETPRKMTVLVTGATGFVGGYLAAACADRGWHVHGTAHPGEPADAPPAAVTHVHRIELTDPDAVRTLIEEVRPDRVFHLAAQASVRRAWDDPRATLHNNIDAQLAILDAIHRAHPTARTLVISSAEVYGGVPPEQMPVDETPPLQPLDPYAVSKVAQEMLGIQYHGAFGMHVVRVRPFNHIGPRQRPGFVAADFARQLARIETGQSEPVMRVGNLSAIRDVSDVRDVVQAYIAALEDGEPGSVYNVASGHGIAMRELLDAFVAETRVDVRIEADPALLRPVDRPRIVGDASRLRARTGWAPLIPLAQTVRDTLDYWRDAVQTD